VYDTRGSLLSILDRPSPHARTFGGVALLDAHFAPSASTGSVLLAAEQTRLISVWSARDGQYISRVASPTDFRYRVHKSVCVDLNGLVYVVFHDTILVLDPRFNFNEIIRFNNGHNPAFSSEICVDDKNNLLVMGVDHAVSVYSWV
jgi:hypothetical protein